MSANALVYLLHADLIFSHKSLKFYIMALTLTSTFFIEAKQVRTQFIETIQKQRWNTELRTASETMIIMYDQMISELELQEIQQDDYCDELFS